MIVDAYVTRPIVGGGNLDLVSSTYNLEGELGLDMGAITWKREYATSPYVHGGIPTLMTKDIGQVSATIQVRATTHTLLQTAIDDLLDAFYQFEYALRVTYESVAWEWKCWAADAAVGSIDNRFEALNVPVRLVIPRSPIPNQGPF